MSERLKNLFENKKQRGEKTLVSFVTAGHPTAELSRKALDSLVDAGVDVLEVGFPFSDPMADGPVIQDSSFKALQQGMNLAATLDLIADFRTSNNDTPIVLMGYYNPIYRMGVDVFCERAAAAGVDALIIVDLPAEENDELLIPAREKGIDFIPLITPTTHGARLDTVLKKASGFLYYVSIAGVTGTKQGDVSAISDHVTKIREKSSLPIMIGFGIKTPENAKKMVGIADGAVVGSALVSMLDETRDLTMVGDFAKKLAMAVKTL